MRLIVIRHGESEHSIRRMIAERRCPGLTPDGLGQARQWAEQLRITGEIESPFVLFSSPVLRARQTADMFAQAFGVGQAELEEDLCEVRVGQADGLSWEEYGKTYGAFDLVADPDRPFAPEGESWHAFIERVGRTFERLAQQFTGQTVVAVTHAGFIVASLLVLFDIPRPGTGAYFDPDFLALTEWRYTGGRWQLVCFNRCLNIKTGSSG